MKKRTQTSFTLDEQQAIVAAILTQLEGWCDVLRDQPTRREAMHLYDNDALIRALVKIDPKTAKNHRRGVQEEINDAIESE